MNELYIWVVDSSYRPVSGAELDAEREVAERNSARFERLDITMGEDQDHWIVRAEAGTRVRLTVRQPNHSEAVHTVTARDEIVQLVIGLRAPGELSYTYGDSRLAFAPNDKTLLLSVSGPRASTRLARLLKNAGIASENVSAEADADADGAFLIIEASIDAARELIDKLGDETKSRLFRVIRHGDRVPFGLANELVARFRGEKERAEIDDFVGGLGLRITRQVGHAGNAFVLIGKAEPSYEILAMADELMASGLVEWVEPNLHYQTEQDAYTPNDPLYAQVPHLTLIGADEAWDQLDNVAVNLRGGSPDIAIAIVDGRGVAPDHPDLTANLTDGTSKLITSMDFEASPITAQTVAATTGDHGTQCAASATAAFDDNRGLPGVAPNSHLLGAKDPTRTDAVEMADAYMWLAGFFNGSTDAGFPTSLPSQSADVISSSYGVTTLALSNTMRDLFDFLTTYGRDGKGCIVLWSLGNSGYLDFTNPTSSNFRAWPTYPRCLGVGASVNTNPTNPLPSTFFNDQNGNNTNLATAVDTRANYSPFGQTALQKPDLVSPSHTAYQTDGSTLYDPILSATRVGTGAVDGCSPGTCNDYDSTFGGTSHSTPTVAGAVALILSARPALSWVQVRDILRQSCVRIDATQTDAIGVWQDLDGDGVIDYSRWYGAGRLDVEAAVNLALDDSRPLADIYVRENLADDGTVPSGGSWWASPDIWVRRDSTEPIPALAWTDAPPHENALSGQDNAVFCRVRNRGAGVATTVNVRALITHWAGLEFVYPDDFQPSNNVGSPVPNPLVPGTYLIGDQVVTDLASGDDQILKFVWPEALVPPETVMVSGIDVTWHPCLLLDASPHDGPPPVGGLSVPVRGDNNIAQRNITIDHPAPGDAAPFIGMIVGSRVKEGVATLVIDSTQLDGARVIRLHLAEKRLMQRLVSAALRVARHDPTDRPRFDTDLVLRDRVRVQFGAGSRAAMIEAAAGSRIEIGRQPKAGFDVSIREYKGAPFIELIGLEGRIELPLKLEGGQFVPLVLQVDGEPRGDLLITQRRGDGEIPGGYGVQYRPG